MRAGLGLMVLILAGSPIGELKAQENEQAMPPSATQSPASFPLEIEIRPPRKVKHDGFYDNAVIETSQGLRLRFTGYHVANIHKRIIDGRLVYDIWEGERNLLTYNVMKEAGLDVLPTFEERMAHELVYGNDIGHWMGGEYKNMSLLEIAHSFNIDPNPPAVGFGGSILGGDSFNLDYDHGQMMFGIVNLSKPKIQ